MLNKKKLAALSSALLLTGSCLLTTASYAWGGKSTQEPTTVNASAVVKNETQTNATSSKKSVSNDATEKVNINTAGVEVLQNMKFMSKTKAQKIVKYREEHGPFKTLDELLNVKCRGIHQNWLDKVSDMFTI